MCTLYINCTLYMSDVSSYLICMMMYDVCTMYLDHDRPLNRIECCYPLSVHKGPVIHIRNKLI